MSQYIFTDWAQICHAAYHYLGITDGRVTEALLGKVEQKLRTIKRHVKLSMPELILVMDEHSVRKRASFIAYKANRGAPQVPCFEIAKALSAQIGPEKFCVSPGNEADDTIATLCARNRGGLSVVVSSDQDLWQLMKPNVRIFNPISKKVVEDQDVAKKYGDGLLPRHLALVKALWGDGGDNVPCAMPRSQRYLRPLVAAGDGTLEDLNARVEENWDSLTEGVRLNWILGEEQLKLNFSLVKLDDGCKIKWGSEALA